ncbi:MAG: sugar MFS transporter [Kiritimatiellia bacterium]
MVPRRHLAIFALLVSCFALWGLLNNMTDNLVPAFQRIFTMDQSRAGLVQVAFYGAYAVLAIFAAVLAEELSYRRGVLIGLAVYIIGALLYIPACIAQSFDVYFIAIFIVAGGCSLLETTCNPYVLAIGDEASAVRRLNFAQMFNPVGSMCGIVLAQQLILSHLNSATAEERALMDEATRQGIIHNELFWVCAPYVGLCAIAALIWLCFFVKREGEAGVTRSALVRVGTALLFSILPMTVLYFLFPELDKILWVLCGVAGPVVYVVLMRDYREMLRTLLRTPRYFLGVVAQFFYVGVQIAAWTWLNVYCQKELGVSPADGAIYYTIGIVLFIVCRWTATFLMKYFNPALMMFVFAVGAILCCAGVMYLPTDVLFTVSVAGHRLPFAANILCLVAMSGFMSLMFPTIYGIALGGLDQKALKLGASGLIMAILGGAIITPWMADIIGNANSFWCRLVPSAFSTAWDPDLRLTQTSLRASFVVPAICFAVVGVYALLFSRKAKSSHRD